MKIRKITVLVLVTSILFSLATLGTSSDIYYMNSCSIFSISLGDTVYFGNNEDYLLNGTYLWLVPAQVYEIGSETLSLPGVMLLGFDHNNDHPADGSMQGGMNEYGLSWDGNGLPAVPMNENTGGEMVWYPEVWVWMQVLLECRNISDVINWFATYNLGNAWAGQGHYCDADGNAMVVSVNSIGDVTFTMMGEENFLVSTNFNLAWPENRYNPYPCPRYATVTAMLVDITTEEDLTWEACKDVLEAVANTQTSYSNVFDPVNQIMYLNILQDFSNTAVLDLHEELAKVTPESEDTLTDEIFYYQQILLADLFIVEEPEPEPEPSPQIPGFLPTFVVGIIMAVVSLISVQIKKKIK